MNSFEVADGAARTSNAPKNAPSISGNRVSVKDSMSGMMGRKEVRVESRLEMEDALRQMIMKEEDAVSSKRGTRDGGKRGSTQGSGPMMENGSGSSVMMGNTGGGSGMMGAPSGMVAGDMAGASTAGGDTMRQPLLAD